MSNQATVCGIREDDLQGSLFPKKEEFANWLKGLRKACNLRLEITNWELTLPWRQQQHPIFDLSAEGKLTDDHVLGRYFPDSNPDVIEIYLYNCMECAKRLGINVSDLIKKVCIHELSHLVLHRGTRAVRSATYFWKRQGEANRELEEHFAQMATYIFLLTSNDDKILEAMKKLSQRQSVIYRTWEVWDAMRTYNENKPHQMPSPLDTHLDCDKLMKELKRQLLWMLSRPPDRINGGLEPNDY